jgi:hypothetical protein
MPWGSLMFSSSTEKVPVVLKSKSENIKQRI